MLMLTILLIVSEKALGLGAEVSPLLIAGGSVSFTLNSRFQTSPSSSFHVDAGYIYYTLKGSMVIGGMDCSGHGGIIRTSQYWEGPKMGCCIGSNMGFFVGASTAAIYGGPYGGGQEKRWYWLLAGQVGISVPLSHLSSSSGNRVKIGDLFLEFRGGNVNEGFTLTSLGLGFNLWLFKWGSELPNQDQEKHKEDQQ